MGSASEEMAGLEAELVKVLQELKASVTKAELLSLEVQCKPGITDKTRKLSECLSALETAAHTKVLKDGKSPATKSKHKKADNKPRWNGLVSN